LIQLVKYFFTIKSHFSLACQPSIDYNEFIKRKEG